MLNCAKTAAHRENGFINQRNEIWIIWLQNLQPLAVLKIEKNRFFSVKIFIFLMIFKNVALHDQRNKKNSLNNVPEKST